MNKSWFLVQAGNAEVSTDRVFREKLKEIAEIASREGANRESPFQGWCAVSVRRATESGRRVVASPTCNNPYHADIVFPHNVIWDRVAQGKHAQSLADAARWLARPNACQAVVRR